MNMNKLEYIGITIDKCSCKQTVVNLNKFEYILIYNHVGNLFSLLSFCRLSEVIICSLKLVLKRFVISLVRI